MQQQGASFSIQNSRQPASLLVFVSQPAMVDKSASVLGRDVSESEDGEQGWQPVDEPEVQSECSNINRFLKLTSPSVRPRRKRLPPILEIQYSRTIPVLQTIKVGHSWRLNLSGYLEPAVGAGTSFSCRENPFWTYSFPSNIPVLGQSWLV